jgi:hypothetical protein
MNVLDFSVLLFSGSLMAGFLGALTGLGGGVVIIPLLTLGFGVDIRYAIGASLVSVIATSSGAAAAYVKEGFTSSRIGMFLQVATTLGALAGAAIATSVPTRIIALIFGLVLIYSALLASRRRHACAIDDKPDRIAQCLKLDGSCPGPDGSIVPYHVHGIPAGFSLMAVAGALSGLLGIGSGAVKVLAMDQAMHLPFKVSTTTSNLMIGVTAAASAGVYLSRGYIDPGLSMPVMLGVLAGSLIGAHVLVKARVCALRYVFATVILALGIEMIYNGLAARL